MINQENTTEINYNGDRLTVYWNQSRNVHAVHINSVFNHELNELFDFNYYYPAEQDEIMEILCEAIDGE